MRAGSRAGAVAVAIAAMLVAGLFLSGGVPSGITPGEGIVPSNADDRERGDAFEFRSVARDVGFDYSYSSGEKFGGRREMATNAGVYVTDYDDDGWPDLLAIGGEIPVLFENVDGEFRRSGALPDLGHDVNSALFFDYDGDGRDDLLLLGVDGTLTLLENRDGSFVIREDAFDVRLAEPMVATAGDYDGDGCVDVFLAQHGDWTANLPTGFENYSAPVDGDNGNPNHLFRGNCSSFERVNDSGIRGSRWSLAASFADLTGDGRLDVHVVNDFNHDIVYRNRGDGTFEQIVLGEATNRNGMASELADVNGDGRLDVFVTNIFYPPWVAERIGSNDALVEKASGNNLLVNRGDGAFVDRAPAYGVAKGGWGWAATIVDLDNDGDQDLVHATQDRSFRTSRRDPLFTDREIRVLREEYPFYQYPAVRERGDGEFSNVSAPDVGFERTDGRGMVRLDYDRDGDQDLAIATTSSYRLYENRGDGQAIQVVVRGTDARRPIGARVTVAGGAGNETLHRIASATTDFLSQGSWAMQFGLGSRERVDVRVTWPDGTRRTFEDVPAGRRIVVTPDGIKRSVPFS
jgi:hypothetical protein